MSPDVPIRLRTLSLRERGYLHFGYYSYLIPMATSYSRCSSPGTLFTSSTPQMNSPMAPPEVPKPSRSLARAPLATDGAFRSTLSLEAEFVLLSARTELQGARLECWEKLLLGRSRCARFGSRAAKMSGRPLDWDVVLSLAASHRVLGLLGRHLSARAWRDVPASVARTIQNYFQTTAFQSTALKTELAAVSHHLESAGIPVVSFKGPTLALGAYGNAGVRPSADLDLLVSRRHVASAREKLRALGYAPEAELTPAQEQIHLRVDSVWNLSRPAPAPLKSFLPHGFAVELHWAITSPCLPFQLDFEALEPHLTTIQLPGVAPQQATVRAISPEELLLILCVHGAKHLWERLIWLCDIAELLAKTPALDWQQVMTQASERGVLRMTVLGLALARDVLGAPVPSEVQRWFTAQPEALRLASQLRASLLTPRSAEISHASGLTHNTSTDRLLMQTIDAPLKRLGFLWHLATTPTMSERAAMTLPRGFDWLWCIVRPARAIQKRLPGKSR